MQQIIDFFIKPYSKEYIVEYIASFTNFEIILPDLLVNRISLIAPIVTPEITNPILIMGGMLKRLLNQP